MNKEQESFFAMTLKVKNFNVQKSAAMVSVPVVAGYYTQLGTLITQLLNADVGSRADLTGYALSKAVKREALELSCQKVSNALASYAASTSDFVLQKRSDFSASSWYNFSEEEILTQGNILKNLSTPLGAALVPFGVTVAEITALGTNLTAFTNILSDPTLAIDQRKYDNTSVSMTIDQIRTLFADKLDVTMRSFEINNPSLYALYQSARAIDINGSMAPPTATVDVPANSTLTVHSAGSYDANTFYTIQNLGTASVEFSLSGVVNTEGPEKVPLGAGETRSRLAENLAASGVYLTVKNAGSSTVKVKVWVE